MAGKQNNSAILAEKHKKEFQNSGILEETIQKYVETGLLKTVEFIENLSDLKITKTVKGSGWLMIYPNSNYYVFKPDSPRANENGRLVKYECPYETDTDLFFPLGFEMSSSAIILTEGIKKAIKAQQEEYHTFSIAGVWNWKSKTTDSKINPNFENFVEKVLQSGKDRIYLCFDNDVTEKEQVKLALERLSVYLLSKNILPLVIKLPYKNGQKLGLDDYLMLEDSDLGKLINKAKVIPEALLAFILSDRYLKLGKSINIENFELADFINEQYKTIPDDYYVINNETYHYAKKVGSKKYEFGLLIKKTNFEFKLIHNTITLTKSITMQANFNRLLKIKSPNEKTVEVKADISSINNAEKLDIFLGQHGHFAHAFKDQEIRAFINSVLEKNNIQKLYVSNNTGWMNIAGINVWVTANKNIYYKDTLIENPLLIRIADKLKDKAPYIIDVKTIEEDKSFIEYINEAKCHYNVQAALNTVQNVMLSLAYNIEKAYNCNVQPFMILGLACMSPFVNWIFEKYRSFPIGYLEGATATGKSNLLNIIAYLFGFDASFPRSGNDTPLNINFNLQQNVNAPLLLNEVGDPLRLKFNEWILKPVFDRTPRRRMKKNGEEETATAINSTLIFNTNASINKEAAIINRLLHTYWECGMFNVTEAKKFNAYLTYLSVLIPYVVENISVNSIIEKIQVLVDSEKLSHIKDERHKVNLAIALTGLDIVFEITGHVKSLYTEQLENKIVIYLQEYEQKAQDDEFDKFMAVTRKIITTLPSNLKKGLDYAEVTHAGQKGLHIVTGNNAETFNADYRNTYEKMYKNSRSLTMKEYDALLDCKDVKKISATYNKKSRYGLFIPYNKFPDVALWFKDYNEGVYDVNDYKGKNDFKTGSEVF